MNEMRKYINLIEYYDSDEFHERYYNESNIKYTRDSHPEFFDAVYKFTSMQNPWAEQKADSDAMRGIDLAFQKYLPKLENSQIVYRGMTLSSWNRIDPDMDFRNNDTIKFNQYISTTLDPNTAKRFIGIGMDRRKTNIPILFSIRTLKGARGIEVNQFDSNYCEFEVILDKHAEFRVVGKSLKMIKNWNPKNRRTFNGHDQKIYVVHLEQIK